MDHKRYIFLVAVLSILAVRGAAAQDAGFVFHLNIRIQPLEDTAAYGGILRDLDSFLRKRDVRTQEEYTRYVKPNLDLYGDIYTEEKNVKPTLMEVIPSEVKDRYIVKLAFMRQDSGGFCSLRLIYNMLAVKGDGGFVFKRIRDYQTRNYARTQVGTIMYIYRNRDEFNRSLAEKADQFNVSLAKRLSLKPGSITYYKFRNPVELFNALGYDFTPTMYVDTTGGRMENDGTLLAANNSEWYPHEMVHFYEGFLCDSAASWIFNEGFATYLGGVERFTLDEMLKRIKKYMQTHPETDIIKNAMKDVVVDHVSFTYALGGLFCKIAYEKYGLEGIRKLLRSGDGGKGFYGALDQVLGIKEKDVMPFVRQKLDKY